MIADDTFNEWIEGMAKRIDAALECDEINNEEHGLLVAALKAIRFSVDTGNSSLAVMVTNAFWGTMRKLQKPALIESVASDSGTRAVKARHDKAWKPESIAALKREYKQGIDKFDKPTTHYKHLAQRVLKDKNKWRQIKRIIEKPSQ